MEIERGRETFHIASTYHRRHHHDGSESCPYLSCASVDDVGDGAFLARRRLKSKHDHHRRRGSWIVRSTINHVSKSESDVLIVDEQMCEHKRISTIAHRGLQSHHFETQREELYDSGR